MSESRSALTMRQNVAAEVRASAARHEYTQEMVGELLGLKQSAISRRYKGQVPFDVDELELLAKAWDVPITEFFPRRHSDGGGITRASWRPWHGTERRRHHREDRRQLVGVG